MKEAISQKRNSVYRFVDIVVEPAEKRVWKAGSPLKLRPKEFELLLAFVRSPNKLLTNAELLDTVWPDAEVAPENITQQVRGLRTAIGDKHRSLIETVAGSGYRLNVAVVEHEAGDSAQGPALIAGVTSPAQRRGVSVPFAMALCIAGVAALAVVLVLGGLVRLRGHVGPQELYSLALKYQLEGDEEQALAALDQAIAADPNFSDAYLRAAFIAYELARIEECRSYLDNARRFLATRDRAFTLKLEALTSELDNDSERSLGKYQLLVDSYPHDTDALYQFAGLAAELGRISEAEKALDTCLTLEPKNTMCHYLRLATWIKTNRFDEVLAQAEALKKENIHSAWFYEPIGLAYFGQNRFEDAGRYLSKLRDARKQLHGTPHVYVANEWEADILLYQGRLGAGIERIRELASSTPSDTERASYYAYVGTVYAWVMKIDDARHYAELAIQKTDDPQTLSIATDVLAMTGKHDGSSGSRNKPQLQYSERFRAGAVALANGRYSQAIAALKLAVELDPSNLNARFLLARAYMRSKRWSEASILLSQVVNAKGLIIQDYVPFLWALAEHHLAVCYEEMGDTERAAQHSRIFEEVWDEADSEAKEAVQQWSAH